MSITMTRTLRRSALAGGRRGARRGDRQPAGAGARRQMVQGRPHPLLRRRRRGRCLRHHRLQRRQAGGGRYSAPKVDYVFSGWDAEKMVQQLREAVAVKPDGIAMMGHPGDAAIMPLAEQATKAGIKMMYQNVPVPKVVAAVRRRLCRRAAGAAGHARSAPRRSGSPG